MPTYVRTYMRTSVRGYVCAYVRPVFLRSPPGPIVIPGHCWLRLPSPAIADKSPDVMEIVAELFVLDKVRGHPACVNMRDVFLAKPSADKSDVWIVMERFGTDLRSMRKAGRRFSLSDLRAFASQVGDAVAFLHKLGFIHADIKTANVLGQDDGSTLQYKLADFGLVVQVLLATSGPPAPTRHSDGRAGGSGEGAGRGLQPVRLDSGGRPPTDPLMRVCE